MIEFLEKHLGHQLALTLSGANIKRSSNFQGQIDNARQELFSKEHDNKAIPATAFVYHDTVGHSWENLVRNSNARCREGKCLGVTFSIAATDGQIRQHHDLTRRSNHAGTVNPRAHGVEVVNLHDPRKFSPNNDQLEVIEAGWYPGGRVISPSPKQLETGYELIKYLSHLPASQGGGLVLEFPFVKDGIFPFRTIAAQPRTRQQGLDLAPGVYAHGHLTDNRSDGYLQAAYSYLRHIGYSPEGAYSEMKKLSAKASPDAELPSSVVAWRSYVPVGLATIGIGAGVFLYLRTRK